MSDVAEVKEAIETYEAAEFKSEVSWPQPPIVDAARRWVRMVSEGEEVQWCRVHEGNPRDCEHKAVYDEFCDVVTGIIETGGQS